MTWENKNKYIPLISTCTMQIENVKGDSVLDGFNFYKAARSTLEVRTQRERIYCCCFRELVGRGTIIMADYFAPDKLIQ